MKNDFYWLIKHFDNEMLDHIRSHFDMKSGTEFMNAFSQLQDEAIQLHNAGVPADSEEGQKFAKNYWKMITVFTDGDISMLSKLVEFGQSEEIDSKWKEKQDLANIFVEQALDVYFTKLGVDPFEKDGE